MTWTYTPTSMADLDTVRRLSGDTDVDDPGVQDEVIAAFLAIWTTPLLAAVAVVDVMLATAARQVPVVFPGGNVDLSSPYDRLLARKAMLLAEQARLTPPAPVWYEPTERAAFGYRRRLDDWHS